MIGNMLRATLSASFTLLSAVGASLLGYYFTRDRTKQRSEYYYRGYDGAIRSYFGTDAPEYPVTMEVRDRARDAYAKISDPAAEALRREGQQVGPEAVDPEQPERA